MVDLKRQFSVGVDIEDIDRFKKLGLKKDKIFLNKVFTKKELKYSFSKRNFSQHLAVRYVAKEAVVKALGNKKIAYNKIEIVNDRTGAPKVIINDKKFRDINIKISMSHCRDKAVAVVMLIA